MALTPEEWQKRRKGGTVLGAIETMLDRAKKRNWLWDVYTEETGSENRSFVCLVLSYGRTEREAIERALANAQRELEKLD